MSGEREKTEIQFRLTTDWRTDCDVTYGFSISVGETLFFAPSSSHTASSILRLIHDSSSIDSYMNESSLIGDDSHGGSNSTPSNSHTNPQKWYRQGTRSSWRVLCSGTTLVVVGCASNRLRLRWRKKKKNSIICGRILLLDLLLHGAVVFSLRL